MFQFAQGTISEIDPAKGLARVQLEEDGIVSGWLQMVFKNTLKTSHTHAFDIGEHVLVGLDQNGEAGWILGALPSKKSPPKNSSADIEGVTFSDGTRIAYDRSNSTLLVDTKGVITIKTTADVNVECQNAKVKAAQKAILETPEGEVTGNWKVGGNLIIAGDTNGTGNFSTSGSLSVGTDAQVAGRVNSAAVETSGDVRAGGGLVGLLSHTHATAGSIGTPSTGIG